MTRKRKQKFIFDLRRLDIAEPQPNFAAFAATLVEGERKCKFIANLFAFGRFLGRMFVLLVKKE
jgi:hypothetical protein